MDGMYLMWRVCAWCKTVMGLTPCNKPNQITHGICPICFEKLMAELDEKAEEKEDKKN